jgi:hypothetical protein
LRRWKILISGLAYSRLLSAPKENAGFDRQGSHHCSTTFLASKNPTFRWAVIWFISFCFLITRHRSLFALWLPSQLRHFFNTRPFICCFSAWEALFFLRTKFTYVAKFPTFVTLSYCCNKSKLNSVVFSPQENYTDRATAACRRS